MAEETEEQESGGGKKTILFIVVLLVAIGASVGGTWFLMKGSAPEPVAVEEPEDALPKQAIYHNLRPPFVVTYFIGDAPRYLQAELTVVSRDQSVIEAVIAHTPLIRSKIINHFADQDFITLQTYDGKQELRESLKALIESIVQAEADVGGVGEVLLTNFVMQ